MIYLRWDEVTDDFKERHTEVSREFHQIGLGYPKGVDFRIMSNELEVHEEDWPRIEEELKRYYTNPSEDQTIIVEEPSVDSHGPMNDRITRFESVVYKRNNIRAR